MLGIPVGKNFELARSSVATLRPGKIFAGRLKNNQVAGTLAALTYF